MYIINQNLLLEFRAHTYWRAMAQWFSDMPIPLRTAAGAGNAVFSTWLKSDKVAHLGHLVSRMTCEHAFSEGSRVSDTIAAKVRK